MDSKDILNLQEAYLEIYQDIDEATRMRKELGKEGEIETRKELAARSRAYKHPGSVDRTIAAAERGSNNPYIKHKRDESDADRKKREERQSKTLRDLAAARRKSVRGRDDSLRGYAAKVEGDDKDLQSARGSARSAGTLTSAEKKKFGESYDVYDVILSHLLDEGYADTQESAEAIMVNMSEEWRESIVENVSSGLRKRAKFVKQRVNPRELITNKERENYYTARKNSHTANLKAAGDKAHREATEAGKSPFEAEAARIKAHKAYEKQVKLRLT